jgi:hypothetical protein
VYESRGRFAVLGAAAGWYTSRHYTCAVYELNSSRKPPRYTMRVVTPTVNRRIAASRSRNFKTGPILITHHRAIPCTQDRENEVHFNVILTAWTLDMPIQYAEASLTVQWWLVLHRCRLLYRPRDTVVHRSSYKLSHYLEKIRAA